MIYENDVKSRFKVEAGIVPGSKSMFVSSKIEFEGGSRAAMNPGDKESEVLAGIRKGQIKGLGDLFYSEARKALFELKVALDSYKGLPGEHPADIAAPIFSKIAQALKIQPGSAAAPKMATAPNGEKVVTNAKG